MKGFTVFYENSAVGTVSVEEHNGCTCFDAICTLGDAPVLRLYGESYGKLLSIGVLMPQGDFRQIRRTFTPHALSAAGFSNALPQRFFLAEHPPEILQTGDALLDAVLSLAQVTYRQTEDFFEISCPFDPTQPSPLAFALTACTVIDMRAILRIKR